MYVRIVGVRVDELAAGGVIQLDLELASDRSFPPETEPLAQSGDPAGIAAHGRQLAIFLHARRRSQPHFFFRIVMRESFEAAFFPLSIREIARDRAFGLSGLRLRIFTYFVPGGT